MDHTSGRPPARAGSNSDSGGAPGFRQVVVAGFRTVNAVWLAPVLLFVLLTPQVAGAYFVVVAMRAAGRQLPPDLIVAMLVGFGSCFWVPVVFFGLPWIVGGVAARFRDERNRTGQRRSDVERANEFYGRSLALMIVCVVALTAIVLLFYVLPMWLLVREELLSGTMAHPGRFVMQAALHPTMIVSAIVVWPIAACVLVAWELVVAATVVENAGLLRATGRAFSFTRDHQADTVRLWLCLTLIGLPNLLLHFAVLRVPTAAMPVAGIAIVSAAYGAYAILFHLAVAESLYLARRPTNAAV